MRQNGRYINKSLRLKDYNYSQTGAYFITICTKKRQCLFGEIAKEEMILNEFGKIADFCLKDIPNHFDNVELDKHVVMPNHVHAIIYLYDKWKPGQRYEDGLGLGQRHGEGFEVGQRYIFDLQKDNSKEKRKYQKIPQIIGKYKAAVTREINKLNDDINFKWQTSFHDHIIRTERALGNIQNYIINNPLSWQNDLENEEYEKLLTAKERDSKIEKFYKSFNLKVKQPLAECP